MKPYVLFITYEVFDTISKLKRSEQLMLRDWMLRIREFPGNHSDYIETDSQGRLIRICIRGKHAIKYWIDDADQHVKIFEIRSSDRG